MIEKPKPCPFCLATPTSRAHETSATWWIECPECQVYRRAAVFADGTGLHAEDEAIRRWNTRQGEGR